MSPREIEQAVLDLEQIRIVIRAPIKEKLGDFSYDRKAAGTTTVSEWLDQRIKPIIEGADVAVVDGTGVTPNGRTSMATLRKSYER